MTLTMTHRGPDEEGYLLDQGIALGMRRLSIIDLADSHQPLSNENGTVSVVLNGEIFNFGQLRREMEAKGHRLTTSGDAEPIVHLYEEHGVDFVRHLRGMFAIALWDSCSSSLILARDRLGVKPLYYAYTPEGLAFASEIKCLLAGQLITPSLDVESAELFLTLGYVPAPRTLFAGIMKLPPAATLVWRGSGIVTPMTYWSPHEAGPYPSGNLREDEQHLLHLLRESVRARMVSDVPLGVMLSGGLDSSLVGALMAEVSSGPVETFSVGFVEDGDANELVWARKTAARLGSKHHELLTSASEHAGLLDEALWHLEEPVADLSFIGFLLLSRLAREHVTVALCGQAADELFAGYPKHRAARVADWVAQLRVPVGGLRGCARLLDDRARLARLLRAVSTDDDIERLLEMSTVITPALRTELVASQWVASDASSILHATLSATKVSARDQSSFLARTLSLDLQLALPDLMFLYFDKMSMAASLEVRVPFADHDVVNFCTGLPDDRLMRRLRGKAILRSISQGLVDDSIISRPKRGFFRSASAAWLRYHEQHVRDTLLDRRCADRGLVKPDTVRRWLDHMPRQGRGGEPLLIAFLLERWHRHFVDADGIAHQRAREAYAAAVADQSSSAGPVTQPLRR